uniref:N-acetyltransferase domain-containing protein n=1 Tax=Amphora coffeiformis TaxID=265554 RepID=A0A7S3P0L7_9STRA
MGNSATLPDDLTLSKLELDLARVCQEANQSQDRWIFHPADADTLNASATLGSTTTTASPVPNDVDTSLLLGITRKSTGTDTSPQNHQQLCTFYLAYSTWEGRVLFWDALVGGDGDANSTSNNDDKHENEILWARLLAKIASALYCRRLVWRHRDALPSAYGDNNHKELTAETLHGWLTIHWEFPELQAFAPYSKEGNDSTAALSTKQAFSMALKESHHDRFRLRLATDADIDTIDRLVMGLAVFEKEPESYILSKQQLLQDGFASHPLYYCILVDDTSLSEPRTCAMAFCYLGSELSKGRFLYLEDLFFEEAYRGKGGGKLLMSTLAKVAQSLGCTKAVWQALYWNSPAINFYNSLGARVQEGLITSRFTGVALDTVAKLPLVDY